MEEFGVATSGGIWVAAGGLSLALLKNNDTFKNKYENQQMEKVAIRKTLNLEATI